MRKDDASTIDYESCVAYYRAGGRIDNAAAIERYLGNHPEIAKRAARDANHELALAHRFDPILDEAIPARLHHHPAPPRQIWLARAGFAATIGLSISAGWWLHGLEFNPHQQATAPATFGQQVAHLAHTTSQSFQSVSGDTQNGVDGHHPDLSEAGYTFSGQRKIATDNHPMTAFVYRNGNGKRVTIYTRSYRTVESAMPDVISPAGTALAHWRSHGADYALTGDLPPASLRELARTATGQTEDKAQRSQQQPASAVDPNQSKTQQAQAPTRMPRHPVDQQSARQQATSGL